MRRAEQARSIGIVTVAVALSALAAAGCATGRTPSTLAPRGPTAGRVATLWWVMFAIALFVCVLVAALFVSAVARRRRAAGPDEEPRWSHRMLLVGGLIFPVVVLTFLWVLTLVDLRANSSPAGPVRMTVDVVGHRWWWEFRYPQQGVVTANELHIPVGVPVDLRLNSLDVQHSFWVPQLAPKTDLYPGRTNHMWIQADRAGVYRGQCAEFCGLEHGLMMFSVVAEPDGSIPAMGDDGGPARPVRIARLARWPRDGRSSNRNPAPPATRSGGRRRGERWGRT